MGMRYEWAHSSDYAGIVTPDELDDLAPDGNDDQDYGIAFVTGSDGCMIYGSLEDLADLARRILADVERAGAPALREGISFTREQVEAWTGFPLTDEQVNDLEETLPNSTFPETVGLITEPWAPESDA